MQINFPEQLDSFPFVQTQEDENLSDSFPNNVSIGNLARAVSEIEKKVGNDESAVSSSIDFRLNSVEDNYVSNGANVEGTGKYIFFQKNGKILEFYRLKSSDTYIELTQNIANKTLDFSFNVNNLPNKDFEDVFLMGV